MTESNAAGMDGRELVITRIFNGPRELVFRLWTEAEHLKMWWGPVGFALDVANADIRPGGSFHYSMTSAEGHVMWGRFSYREISPPEKLVFVNSFSDAEGNIARAPFSEKIPLEILKDMTFTEHGAQTHLTLRGRPINATEEEMQMYESMFDSMQEGFGGTFDKLDVYLAQQI
jgi:uncharacterized protein YndB with AHSA1/START domain